MITSHTEKNLDIFNFSWVIVSQVKHARTTREDLLLHFMTVYILISVYMSMCLVGTSTQLHGLECAAVCVATVCLGGIFVPFSNYFVSQFAS